MEDHKGPLFVSKDMAQSDVFMDWSALYLQSIIGCQGTKDQIKKSMRIGIDTVNKALSLGDIGERSLVIVQQDFADITAKRLTAAAKAQGKEITCKKGCSYCCEIMVTTSEMEARVIYETHADKINWAVISKQSVVHNGEDWANMPKEVRSCVFLEGGTCAIYEDRPAECRGYLVISDPTYCDVEYAGPHKVQTVKTSPDTEISYGMQLALETVHSLAYNLLKIHKEKKSGYSKS